VKATPTAASVPPKVVTGQLEHRAFLPRWVFPAVLIVALLLCCGVTSVLGYVFFGDEIRGRLGALRGPTPTPWQVAFSATQTAQAEGFAATQTAVVGANAATQTAVAVQATQAAEAAQATQTAQASAAKATATAQAAQAAATQTALAGANAATQTAVAVQATKIAQVTEIAQATHTAQAAATQTAQAGITPPLLKVSPVIVKPITRVFLMPQVAYDLLAEADKATWQSGAGNLPWPGATDDNRGFARWVTDATLEDDSTASKALQTHPQWVANGFIQGSFTDIYHSGYTVDADDYFMATVGLLKNASGGSVEFRVMIRTEGGGNIWIATVSDSYDGSLKTIEVPLSAWAGKRADFILRVEAGSSSSRDWAIWSKARIERR
jgi:hypothetical protein